MSEEPTQRVDEATHDGALGITGRDGTGPYEMLERGATVGRYVVLGHIGSGGMGAVFAAHDPELDRKVALKLLHREHDVAGKSAQDRLVREAQAMAKLRHPNVVVVHDVGVIEGRVFFAMEFVEGTTLTHWLGDGHRELREILDVMIAAGRGLAAAHRAGIVHRDFKPDNVLIGITPSTGVRDGTVVVTDFGLARALDRAADSTPGPSQVSSNVNILASPLTVSGAVLGTPAYMAPEQFDRGDAGPAADQFGYCVALHQAVYGVRPFAASSIAELVASVTSGRVVEAPPGRRVPTWLRRVILRGLSVDPAARWPSMDALLDRLAHDPIRRKQVATLVGAAALAGTIGVLAASGAEAPAPSDPCPPADDRLAGIWDAAKRDELRFAFAATGLPYAETTADTVVARLDDYAGAWVDGQRAACVATRVDGTQSEALLDLRSACYERRKSELAVRVDALVATDAALIERAVEYVSKLVPLDVCADTERLASTELLPEDPGRRAEVDALLGELDLVDAQLAAGRADEALVERVRALVERADATGHHPTRAEALYRLARVFDHLAKPELARAEHERALAAAAIGRHDRLAATIWSDLVFVVGNELDRLDEAITLAQSAELAVVRDGDRPEQRAILDTNLGTVMREKGEWTRAIELNSHAVELRRALYGEDDLRFASSLNNLGNAYNANGEFERGLALLEQSLAIRRKASGDAHPRVAEALNNIGTSLHGMGRFAEARTHFEESLAIRQRLWGDEHPLVASTMGNLGSTLADLELLDQAEPVQRRALALTEKVHGKDSAKLAMPLNNLANTLERRNHNDEALALHERSLALRKRHDGEGSASVAFSLTNIGVLLDNMGRPDDARPRFEAALAIYDRVSPDHPDAVNALVRLGQLEATAGNNLRAAELASRAVAICERTKFSPLRKAEADYVLAQVRWETGDHRRAVGHAERALAFLRESGVRTDLATAIEEWLATHVP